MVYAAAEPIRDRDRIAANVWWLEGAQLKPGDRVRWPGTWTYSKAKSQPGDHSNTQYALLGLNAADEVGVAVKPAVWELSRLHFERFQDRDGGWSYTPLHRRPTGSMTCAGISGLVLTGRRRSQGQESIQGEAIRDCGQGTANRSLQLGINWLAAHLRGGENFGSGQTWKFYYLYGLERGGPPGGPAYPRGAGLVPPGRRGTGQRAGRGYGGLAG